MPTVRKLSVKPKPKSKPAKARTHPRLTAAGEPWPKPLSNRALAARLKWLDEDPPFKMKGGAIEGEELEEAIRTGGL